MNLVQLQQYGIDYKTGIARCMDDEEFYIKLLSMFLKDDCFIRAREAYQRGDYTELFQCLHELKGVCGNTAMTELYEAVSRLVELLRGQDGTAAEVSPLFAEIEAAYGQAIKGVSRLMGE